MLAGLPRRVAPPSNRARARRRVIRREDPDTRRRRALPGVGQGGPHRCIVPPRQQRVGVQPNRENQRRERRPVAPAAQAAREVGTIIGARLAAENDARRCGEHAAEIFAVVVEREPLISSAPRGQRSREAPATRSGGIIQPTV